MSRLVLRHLYHLRWRCLLSVAESARPWSKNLQTFTVRFSGNKLSSENAESNILEMQLHNATPKHLKELIESHHRAMNNDQLVSALERLCLYKINGSISSDVVSASYFENLCRQLRRQAPHFVTDDVVAVIKCLTQLGVSSRTPTLQTYFQMLRHQINDLTLQQVVFLDFLLRKQNKAIKEGESVPLIDALLVALPLVFENQLNLQMDPDNLPELVRCFEYGAYRNASDESMKKLADAIVDHPAEMDLASSLSVIWSSIKTKKMKWAFEHSIVDKGLKVIRNVYDRIPPKDLTKLMISLSKQHCFCPPLLEAVARRAIAEKWPLTLFNNLMDVMVKYDMTTTKELNCYANLIVASEHEVKTDPSISIFTILKAFEQANYTPKNIEVVLRVILDTDDKIRKLTEHPVLFTRFALCFAVFDSIPPIILDTLQRLELKSFVNEDIPSDVRAIRLQQVLLLSQVMESQNVRLDWPDDLKLEGMMLAKKERMTVQSVLEVLCDAFGGSQYVSSRVYTKSRHFVDHFVALQGDQPVELNGSTSEGNIAYIENLRLPQDSKRVAIVVHNTNDLTRSGKRAHGLACLRPRLLAGEGFHVVEINLSTWQGIPYQEKVPYIMQRVIKQDS